MPFGKYKGTLIADIPVQYLRWGAENLRKGIQRQFQAVLDEIDGVEKKPVAVEVLFEGTCADRFDPTSDWPGRQDWDGVTAPWLDQWTIDSGIPR